MTRLNRAHSLLHPIAAFFVVASFLMAAQAATLAQGESLGISSKRYIVIDATTGEVIAEQNADERVAIASLTKVFTTIEALERGDLDQVITTTADDLYDSTSTRMGFGAGESFTLRDLLYGMMLPSGNDAAHAIARALGATEGATNQEAYDNFIRMMNERAANIGLTNTQFMNPHGWGVDGHYSTARDVATFVMYALQFPEFEQIIGTSSYTTSDGRYTVVNTNRLLTDGFSGLVGGKTGYDDDAGYCLVEVARRDSTTIVSVTLDGVAPNVWYQDNATLLNYGFDDRQERATSGGGAIADILSWRDPDLAQIVNSSQSGGSLSGVASDAQEQQAAPVAAPSEDQPSDAPVEAIPIEAEAGTTSESESLFNSTILGVIAVGLLIAGVAALKAFGPGREPHQGAIH